MESVVISINAVIAPEVMAAMNERNRQITGENWSLEHDDDHKNGELANAAVAYILPAIDREMIYKSSANGANNVPEEWPDGWDPMWFKPAKDSSDLAQRLRELEKGIALALAEYGRIHRLRDKLIRAQSGGLTAE